MHLRDLDIRISPDCSARIYTSNLNFRNRQLSHIFLKNQVNPPVPYSLICVDSRYVKLAFLAFEGRLRHTERSKNVEVRPEKILHVSFIIVYIQACLNITKLIMAVYS